MGTYGLNWEDIANELETQEFESYLEGEFTEEDFVTGAREYIKRLRDVGASIHKGTEEQDDEYDLNLVYLEAIRKYRFKKKEYGTSWQDMNLKNLRHRIGDEFGEWDECDDKDEFGEIIDIINCCMMVGARLLQNSNYNIIYDKKSSYNKDYMNKEENK